MAYSFEHDPINPDAIPLYNSSIFKFWNWFDTTWSCIDWMNWHRSMVKKYGNSTGGYTQSNFLKHWNNLAMASGAIDCRSFNTTFRSYMSKVGLLDSLYDGIGIIAKPIGGIISAADNIGGGITGATKVLKIVLPVLMVVISIFFIIYAAKKSGAMKK